MIKLKSKKNNQKLKNQNQFQILYYIEKKAKKAKQHCFKLWQGQLIIEYHFKALHIWSPDSQNHIIKNGYNHYY